MGGENQNTHLPNVRFEASEGIRRPALSQTAVFAYALAQLGFPVVDVEVESQQLGIFLEVCFDEYNKWLPVEKTSVLKSVTGSIQKYDLAALGAPFGRGVVDAVVVQREQFFSPISGVFALGIPHPISHLSPDQYDLALRYINEARKIYSSVFHFKWEEPILWAFLPSGFGGPFSLAYTYSAEASVPADIRPEDHAWFKKFFFNHVKQAVGEGRAKFSSIPGPAQQELRSQAMIDESREDIEKLEEQIQSKSYWLTPPLGPGGKM